jgi:hypothetical protein
LLEDFVAIRLGTKLIAENACETFPVLSLNGVTVAQRPPLRIRSASGNYPSAARWFMRLRIQVRIDDDIRNNP